MVKHCKVVGCQNKHFAKELCHAHYELKRRNGDAVYKAHKCLVPSCNKKVWDVYCLKHKRQFRLGIPFDSPAGWAVKGKRNQHWNGGTSQYKDHYLLKKLRKKIIIEKKGKCEICGGRGNEIHHRDENKANHVLENLILCCHKCHFKVFHTGVRKKSKYMKNYGFQAQEIAIKLGVSPSMISVYHRKGILNEVLSGEIKIRKQCECKGSKQTVFEQNYDLW